MKKEHLIEIKALGNPPLAVKVKFYNFIKKYYKFILLKTVLSGLVILLESHIESKGGHLI